jgi:hypothetical protein
MPKMPLLIEETPILPVDPVKKTEKESKCKCTEDAGVFIVFRYHCGEKTLKLKLLFIVMDLLTLLVYPIVFVHNKLRPFSKSKARIPVPNLLAIVPVTPGKMTIWKL